MKRYVVTLFIVIAVVGCAATGVVQQVLQDTSGSLVWKAMAALVNVQSESTSNHESIPRYSGTGGSKIETTGVYIDDSNNLGVNTTSSTTVGARLHVRQSGTGMLMPATTSFAVQDNATSGTNCYAAFCSGAEGKSIFYFGHPTDYDRGAFEYDCATDDMKFSSTDDLKFEGDNVHVTANNTYVNGKLCVDETLRIHRNTVNSNYTADSVTPKDYYIGVTASGCTITLPVASAVGEGRVFVIKSEFTVPGVTTIDPDGACQIDAGSNVTVSALRAVEVISDGTSYWTF